MTRYGGRPGARRTIWFAIVGGAATAIYAIIAVAGSSFGWSAALSSLVGAVVSSVLSFAGHRALTFRSTAPVAETAPRFVSVVCCQYLVALVIPALATDLAGVPGVVSYAAVCVVVPLASYLVLSRFVFRTPLPVPRTIDPIDARHTTSTGFTHV